MALTEQQKISQLQKEVPRLIQAMAAAGYSQNLQSLSLPQFVLETDYFTNTGYKYNNPAGITYSTNQTDSTPGPKRPQKEGGYYSAYTSLQPALKKHLNIVTTIKKKGNTQPIPASAISLTQFARLLFANGYYVGEGKTEADKINNYANGLIGIQKRIDIAFKKKSLISKLYQLFFY